MALGLERRGTCMQLGIRSKLDCIEVSGLGRPPLPRSFHTQVSRNAASFWAELAALTHLLKYLPYEIVIIAFIWGYAAYRPSLKVRSMTHLPLHRVKPGLLRSEGDCTFLSTRALNTLY